MLIELQHGRFSSLLGSFSLPTNVSSTAFNVWHWFLCITVRYLLYKITGPAIYKDCLWAHNLTKDGQITRLLVISLPITYYKLQLQLKILRNYITLNYCSLPIPESNTGKSGKSLKLNWLAVVHQKESLKTIKNDKHKPVAAFLKSLRNQSPLQQVPDPEPDLHPHQCQVQSPRHQTGYLSLEVHHQMVNHRCQVQVMLQPATMLNSITTSWQIQPVIVRGKSVSNLNTKCICTFCSGLNSGFHCSYCHCVSLQQIHTHCHCCFVLYSYITSTVLQTAYINSQWMYYVKM